MKEYIFALAAGLFVACQPAKAPVAPAPAPETIDACLDRVLKEAGLNRFGDPPDRMYAGGSPLFDEASGKATPRLEYVRARQPALAAKCDRP